MNSGSTRNSRIISGAFVFVLVVSAIPASATLLSPPATTSNTSAVRFCSPQVGGIHAGEAALLAACAGIKLANGDFEGADVAAISAARLIYGDAVPARVLETYAHEYAFIQNPVLNPGFQIDESHPYSSPHAGFWTGDYSMANGMLGLSGAQSATQLFGAAASDASSNTGTGKSYYWGPQGLSLDYSGAGTVNVTLGEITTGTQWIITVALPAQASLDHAAFDLLQEYRNEKILLNGQTPGNESPVTDVLPVSALVSITLTPGTSLVVDNLALTGAAYGPDPKVAINLDDPSSNDVVTRVLPTADDTVPASKTWAATLPAHDDVSTLIIPLAFAPAVLAGAPGAVGDNVQGAASGTWTLFVAAIQHTASGPRVLTPTSGIVSLDGGPLGNTITSTVSPFDSIGPLAAQDVTGKLYAQLLAAQGMDDVNGGVVTLDVNATHSVFVHADVSTAELAGKVSGYYNSAKLAHPDSAFNDALDIVLDSLYGERQALSTALYASERHADTNDGVLGMIRPHGAVPFSGGVKADTLLLPDPAGDYDLDVSFVDYHGATVQGSYAYVAFFSPEGLAQAAANNWNGEWYNLAEFRACSHPLGFTTCEFRFDPAEADGIYHVPIAGKILQSMKLADGLGGLGGRFFPVAFLHVNDATPDRELLNTIPGRAAYNPVVNGIADMASTPSGVGSGEANVGPYWLYAAADAISMAGNPLVFAPASDAADGYAVLIQPQNIEPTQGIDVLKPDINGQYSFKVSFRAYSSAAMDDRRFLDAKYLGFHLTDAPSQLGLESSGQGLWSRWQQGTASSVKELQDGYVMYVPAWEIPLPTAADPDANQTLTAWASLWHPDYATSGTTAHYATDDDANLIGGFYNAQKNALATDPVADQMDNTPGAFRLDRALEKYAFSIIGSNATADRNVPTDLAFLITNDGAFNDDFVLTLDAPSMVQAGFGSVDGPKELRHHLDAGSSAIIPVASKALDAMQNEESALVNVKMSLAHKEHPGMDSPVVQANATLSVGQLLVDLVGDGAVPDTMPGHQTSAIFKLDNNGIVTDSFNLDAVGIGVESITVTPPRVESLAPGASVGAIVSFKVKDNVRFGSNQSVSLAATPDHGSEPPSDFSLVPVPNSTMKLTKQSGDTSLAKAGDLVTFSYLAEYAGPYQETFSITPTHGVLSSAGYHIFVDGTNVTTAPETTFTSPGSKKIDVSFAIPSGTSFGTTDTTTLKLASTDFRSSASDSKQNTVALLKSLLSDTQPVGSPAFALQEEGVKFTFDLTFDGNVPWTFTLEPTDIDPIFKSGSVSVVPSSWDVSGSGQQSQAFTIRGTLANGAAYGASGSVSILVNAIGETPWVGDLPQPHATAGVFTLVPTVKFTDASEVATFPSDITATHNAVLGLAALPSSDETTDWNGRSVVFDFSVVHSDPDHWTDAPLAPITLAPGGSQQIALVSTPSGASGTDHIILSATARDMQPLLNASNETTTRIFDASDFGVHTMLVGCYGTGAADCQRAGGPIQAVTTHDLPDASYSRGYLITSLVQKTDPSAPVFLEDGTLAVTATLTSLRVDKNVGDLFLVREASATPEDGNFSYIAAGPQIVAFPTVVPLSGTKTFIGTTTLLWDTQSDPQAVTWLLEHLGTAKIGVSVNVHGLSLTGGYGVDEAMFPVDGSKAGVSQVGTALFLTDKDDQDGDGYAAVSELRSNSNPVLKSSTPYTDEDNDGYVNIRDIVGIIHEECLVRDTQDDDWEPCPADASTITPPPVAVRAAAPAGAPSFGPPEVAYYLEHIVAAYSVGSEES